MTQKLGLGFGFTKKACFVCGSMIHLIKDCTFHEDIMAKKSVLPNNVGKGTGHKESRPVWNNAQRINHQNKFAPTSVFTRSGRILVSAAKPKVAASTSAAKPVNTAGPKQSVHFSKSKSNIHKSHSPIRDLDKFCEMKGSRGNIAMPELHSKMELQKERIGLLLRSPLALVLISAGNQTDKNEGPQDTNGNKAQMIRLHDKPKDDIGSKTVEEPVNKKDQAYRDELERLMSQEKEASDAADTLRKDAYGDDLDIFTSPVQSVGAEADFNNMDSSTVMEPKKVAQALDDESWVEAMQEQLPQFSL
nr:ribonuclease H-like domain-containing protein [Tanacetum cinerariifolium]